MKINEGINYLTVELAPELVPCVYCNATFATEQALISHMEANHPDLPYFVWVKSNKDPFHEDDPVGVEITGKFYAADFVAPGEGKFRAYSIRFDVYGGIHPAMGYYHTSISQTDLNKFSEVTNLNNLLTQITLRPLPPGTYDIRAYCKRSWREYTDGSTRIEERLPILSNTGQTITII